MVGSRGMFPAHWCLTTTFMKCQLLCLIFSVELALLMFLVEFKQLLEAFDVASEVVGVVGSSCRPHSSIMYIA